MKSSKQIRYLFLLAGLALAQVTQASVIYNWQCDVADCNGDPSFSSTIEITDSAFAAGDFTGVIGNVVSWDTTSGVGDGFSVHLGDMLSSTSPGSTINDDDNLRIILSGNRLEISEILDISAGTNITFDSNEGRVDFFEGSNYSVGSLRDGPIGSPFYPNINIQGRFVRAVPEPASIALLGLGLAVLAVIFRRKRR